MIQDLKILFGYRFSVFSKDCSKLFEKFKSLSTFKLSTFNSQQINETSNIHQQKSHLTELDSFPLNFQMIYLLLIGEPEPKSFSGMASAG